MRSRLSFALFALLAVAGCKSSVEEVEQTSLSVIADQAHGSRTGFWFLPPMVPSPQLAGTFLGGLSPVVRIDELDASLQPLRTLATFTRSTGPGSETVRETTEPLYIVNWKTRQFDLDPNRLYRVNVLLSDRVVGFADVKIVANKNEAKRIDTNEFVPLWSDGTLPIKFWINRCGPIVCAPLDQCHVAGVCDGATGVCTNPVAAEGTTCSDGNACTRSDSCQAGSCLGADPVVCTAADQCHVAGVCDPASGSCTSPAAEEGTSCDDGDACTATDTCSAGACVGQGTVPACLPSEEHVMLVGDQTDASVLAYDWPSNQFQGAFIESGTGGLTSTLALTKGPDGHVYIGNRSSAGHSILRFDGETLAPKPAPGRAGALFAVNVATGPFAGPNQIRFGADGHLYLATNHNSTVERYHGLTGEPLPAPGQTGAVFATTPGVSSVGIAFGPDGKLYVARFNFPPGIERHDPITGAYIDEFVTTNTNVIGSRIDSLDFGPDGNLYVGSRYPHDVGQGWVLRFDGQGNPLPAPGKSGALFADVGQIPGYLQFAPDGLLYLSAWNYVGETSLQQFDKTTGARIAFIAKPSRQSAPYSILFVKKPTSTSCFSHVGQGPADPGGNGGFTTIREGNRLYETAYNGGIRIYDISTGTAPTLVGTIALPGVRALAVRGDLAYVSYFGAGPTVFDVSNPASATKLWQAAPRVGDDASLALELSGNILVETSGMRLRTYDLTDPRAPVEVGVVGFMAGVEIVMDGTTAYVAGTHQGVRKVDITNPAAPVIVSTVDPPGSGYLRNVALTADAVLAADDTAGLHVLARGTLAPLGFVPLEGGAFGITVRGNQAFVATSDAIVIFDVSTPAAPVLVRRVQVHPRLSTRSSVLGDGLAWVAGGVLPSDAGTVPTLHVIDVGCL